MAVGLIAGLALILPSIVPATATPVREILASWVTDASQPVKTGESVLFQVQANANDSAGLAGVQDNYTITATVEKAEFRALPPICKTTGVDPVSAITDGGTKITCNVGSIANGTSIRFETQAFATGSDGELIKVAVATDGATAELPPVKITSKKQIDLISKYSFHSAAMRVATVDGVTTFFLPFALILPFGSDQIANTAEFDLKLTNGTSTVKAVDVLKEVACGNGTYSPAPEYPRENQLFTCAITPTGPGTWHVKLSGFNNALGGHHPLGVNNRPVDGIPLAVGGISFTNTKPMFSTVAGATTFFTGNFNTSNLKVNTLSGVAVADINPANEANNFVITLIGTWAEAYIRSATAGSALSGVGTTWDAKAEVVAGDTLPANTSNSTMRGLAKGSYPRGGTCVLWDKHQRLRAQSEMAGRYRAYWHSGESGTPYRIDNIEYLWQSAAPNLLNYNCDNGDWRKTGPATPEEGAQVHGVRLIWDGNAPMFDPNATSTQNGDLSVWLTPLSTVAEGTHIWTAGQVIDFKGNWINSKTFPILTAVSDDPTYAGTNSALDMLRMASTRAIASKASSATAAGNVGDLVTFTITGGLNGKESATGTVTMADTLPAGLEYVAGSASEAPQVSGKTLTWTNLLVTVGSPKVITYQARLLASGSHRNSLTVTNTTATADPNSPLAKAEAAAAASAANSGYTELIKTVEGEEFAVNGDNTWKLTITNKDVREQPIIDIVDILPYNGDGRATNYVGSYNIGAVTTTLGTIYYASADPATISADPAAASNGSLGSPSAVWSTTKPAKVTAIRIVAANVPVLGKIEVSIPFSTSGIAAGNVLENLSVTKASTTTLQMIRSSVSTVAAEGSVLQVDKVADGTPDLVPNGTITYTLTAKNSGTGTAHDVVLTDKPGPGLERPVFSAATQGVADADNANIWKVGTLAAEASASVKVTYTITKDLDYAKGVTNAVTVSNPSNPAPEGGIPNTGVDADTDQFDEVVVKTAPSLQIDKKLAAKPISADGKSVIYEIAVRNNGTGTAADVVVEDLGGVNLAAPSAGYVWSNLTQGSADAAGLWQVGTLKVGEVAVAVVTVPFAADRDLTVDTVNAAITHAFGIPRLTADQIAAGKTNVDVASDDDRFDAVPLPNPVLRVDKAVDGTPELTIGKKVTYTLTAKNIGKGPAYDVILTDTPGAGLADPVFSDGTQGAVSAASANVWSVGELAPGESASVKVTYTITQDLDFDLGLVNTVKVSNPLLPAPETGWVVNDGVGADTDQVDQVVTKGDPSLQVDKKLAEKPVSSDGKTVTYQVSVGNNGKGTATNVVVEDLGGVNLAAGAAGYVWSSMSKGAADAAGLWQVGTLKVGEVATATITVPFVAAPDLKVDTVNAVITHATEIPRLTDEQIAAGKTNADLASDDDRFDAVPLPNPVLRVDKAVDGNPDLFPGGTITYTLTAKNVGAGTAYDVILTDTPGLGLTDPVFSDGTQGAVDASNANIWVVGELAPGASASVKVTYKITDKLDYQVGAINTVKVSNPLLSAPETGWVVNDGVDADTDQVDQVVTKTGPSLQVDKKLAEKPVSSDGKTVTYQVAVGNNGTATAANVVVEDLGGVNLAAGAAGYVWSSMSQGTADAAGLWQVGTLKVGEVATATITVPFVAAPDLKVETVNAVITHGFGIPRLTDAQIAAGKTNADLASDDDRFDAVPLPNPVLRVDKAVDGNPDLFPGGTITYTLTAKNVGKGAAYDVILTDTPGLGLTDPVFSDGTQGAVDASNANIWVVGELAPGASASVKVTYKITDKLDYKIGVINTVKVSNPLLPAPETGWVVNEGVDADTDQVDQVVTTAEPKLQLDKKLADNPVNAENKTVTYVVSVRSSGTATATNVVVEDLGGVNLGAPATGYVWSSMSQGTADAAGLWQVGTLKVGEVATAKITVPFVAAPDFSVETVNAAITHAFGIPRLTDAQIAAGKTNADVTSDDDRFDAVPLPNPVLQVDKALVAKPRFAAGEPVSYTITVRNGGEVPALEVKVRDIPVINLGADQSWSSMSQGSFVDGVWQVGTLPAGGEATAVVTLPIADDPDWKLPLVNQVVTDGLGFPPVSDGEPVGDLQVNDKVTDDTDRADEVAIIEEIGLKIDKRALSSSVAMGGTVEFMISVTNVGPDTAADVVVVDHPIAGLTNLVGVPEVGTFDSDTRLWQVGDLKPGQVVSMKVTAKVTGAVINIATVENPRYPAPLINDATVLANPDLASDVDQWDKVTLPLTPVSPKLPKTGVGDWTLIVGLLGLLAIGLSAGFLRRRRLN